MATRLIGRMTALPEEVEAAVRSLSPEEATELHNRLITSGRRWCFGNDPVSVAQKLDREKINPDTITKEIEMLKRSEVKTAKTAELVATYNKLTGKSIKKFSDRATAEKQVLKVLPEEGDAAAKPVKAKLPRKSAGDGKKRGRAPAFTHVTLTTNKGKGRLNENSLRAKLQGIMQKKFGENKKVPIEEVEAAAKGHVDNVRGVLAKMVLMDWVNLS